MSGLIKQNKFREAPRIGGKFLNNLAGVGLTRDSPLLRDVYISLGIAFANLNDRKAAEGYYQTAIDVAQEGDNVTLFRIQLTPITNSFKIYSWCFLCFVI